MKNANTHLITIFLLSSLWLFTQYNTTPIIPVGLILLILWTLCSKKSFKSLWRKHKKKTILSVVLGTVLGFLGTGLYLSADYIYKYDLGAQVGVRTLLESQYFPPTQYINVFTDTQSGQKVAEIKQFAQGVVDMFNQDPVAITNEFVFIQGQQLTPQTAEQILPAMAKETGKVTKIEYLGYAPNILHEDKTKASTLDVAFKVETETGKFKFLTLNILETEQGYKLTGINFLGKSTKAKIQENNNLLPTPNDLVVITVNRAEEENLDTEEENNDTPEAN